MFVRLDGNSAVPAFQQIVDQVKAAIARGACKPGEMIPSVRQMAARALVNPNTVAKAYRELERDEVITPRKGLGMFVADTAPERCRRERRSAIVRQLQALLSEGRQAGIDDDDLRQIVDAALGDNTQAGSPG